MTTGPRFKRPAYAIPAVTGVIAMALIPGLYFVWPELPYVSDRDQTALFVLAVFLVMALYEILFEKIYNSVGTGLVFRPANFADSTYIQDYQVKLVGLAASFTLLAAFYFTADIYRSDWYTPFFSLLSDYWPVIVAVIVINVSLAHFAMRHPRDGLWHLGRLVLSLGRRSAGAPELKNHLLSLGIKGFFLPLMFCYLVYDWTYLSTQSLWAAEDFSQVYAYLYRFSFFFDLTIVVMGYALGMRVLNSQIRWPESTVGGWLVCIVCYAPFWQLLSREYFDYVDDDSLAWGAWLWDYPVWYGLWGGTILALLAIYAMSSARMGLRFSNLTYRGLACDFPYNLSKHPAYLSKNATWWLISIPFLATDFMTGLSNCLALAGVNLIYFLRARYEENCLAKAPSYRAYQRHINKYGLIARVRRLVSGQIQGMPEKEKVT